MFSRLYHLSSPLNADCSALYLIAHSILDMFIIRYLHYLLDVLCSVPSTSPSSPLTADCCSALFITGFVHYPTCSLLTRCVMFSRLYHLSSPLNADCSALYLIAHSILDMFIIRYLHYLLDVLCSVPSTSPSSPLTADCCSALFITRHVHYLLDVLCSVAFTIISFPLTAD